MWFKNSYRRHLCDIHIEDWNPEFLSEFDPYTYYNNLKKANVQSPMIYFQSHVGYCYFPTKTAKIHGAFKDNPEKMKILVDLCHKGNMDVIGYYSLIFNNWAYYNHPSWRMIEVNGKTNVENGKRYGLCCPNNLEYRDFVSEQIAEMADYFEFEGMFFDMPFWDHACYCDSCKKRWKTETGLDEIPDVGNLLDEVSALHIKKRQDWMGEFSQFATNRLKKLKPGVSVTQNFASAVCSFDDTQWWCTDSVNNACDYSCGDLYGGISEQSVACKFYRNISKAQPFEYMTSRCNPNLNRHTITKSADQLMVTTMITYAHHGAMLLIDAIDPTGSMNEKVYDLFSEVFSYSKNYEEYMRGEMVEDFSVYYNLLRKGNLRYDKAGAHLAGIRLSKSLAEEHIPFGIVSNADLTNLKKHKLVMIPYANTISSENLDYIFSYVESGGSIYFSGGEEKEMLKRLLGAELKGYTEEAMTYISPKCEFEGLFEGYNEKYPLPVEECMPIIEAGAEAEILATITLPYTNPADEKFSSIHSNPPGIKTNIPAVAMARYGKGSVIWSAHTLESEEISDYKAILFNLINTVCPKEELSVLSDAPKNVELVTFKSENEILISAVTIDGSSKIPITGEFNICVKSESCPASVNRLNPSEAVEFIYDGNYIKFTAKESHIFDMYQIIL